MEWIAEYILFDLIVQRWICEKAGWLVDFDKPTFEILIDHDVETDHLEAEWIFNIQWFGWFINMCHVVHADHEGFDTNVFDVLPDIWAILVYFWIKIFVNVLKYSC